MSATACFESRALFCIRHLTLILLEVESSLRKLYPPTDPYNFQLGKAGFQLKTIAAASPTRPVALGGSGLSSLRPKPSNTPFRPS